MKKIRLFGILGILIPALIFFFYKENIADLLGSKEDEWLFEKMVIVYTLSMTLANYLVNYICKKFFAQCPKNNFSD